MTVKNLSHISLDEIIKCFLVAFEDYSIKMPSNHNYFKERWEAANVDFHFSYGMFDKGNLVGFIIHAIDKRAGALTAFNTGTGVIPEYRGNRIVKSIYDHALKDLTQNGITRCTLEVITTNDIAIRSYKSVGFQICTKYKCYSGDIKIEYHGQYDLKELELKNIDWEKLPNQQYYSWDFQKETILKRDYKVFHVLKNDKPESYFIINADTQYLAQFDLIITESNGWDRLFSGINQISKTIKIINVDERLKDKHEYISIIGLENSIDQYEMELILK